MFRKIFNSAVYFSAFICMFSSCKKEDNKPEPFVFYSIAINGNTVSFTNKSTGAASYKWDFGDGIESTEESPVHSYPGKGKYVPTLYATSSDGITGEASTVIYISKTSPVKLDDHSLADWDTITYNKVVGGAGAGNFITAKYDYDGDNVYFYFEQKTSKSNGNIYDLYIDADNDISTGYLTNEIPGGAYEILLEGTIFDGWLDVYYHSGDQSSFDGYQPQSINEFYTVGTWQEKDGILKFEGALKRSKLKGLTGQGLKIGVQVASYDWSAIIGYSPDIESDAFFLDMSQ
ncbi:MAG TPA: PKD domain-containing protein [Chitinophagaceae bacterium]